MRKKKAPQTAPRKDTKRGCLDCTHYPVPNTKEPCKSCERLSRWEEKEKDNG